RPSRRPLPTGRPSGGGPRRSDQRGACASQPSSSRILLRGKTRGRQIVGSPIIIRPMSASANLHAPVHPVRFVTAASLFDGHDAAINIMRRILQSQGAEVIHLGHNRSVDEVATAAVQEDVAAVAISSYQGGGVVDLEYLLCLLDGRGEGEVVVEV